MQSIPFAPGHVQRLEPYGRLPETVHVFDADSIAAVNAALAAGRPLLVRGEPGTGKSQLARAAASALGRALLPFTVDARTESRDLLFTVDMVARLAEAQVMGHRPLGPGEDARERLAEIRYTTPGPLWWVLDWAGAENLLAQWQATGEQPEQRSAPRPWTPAGWKPALGAVLLIDEIDKADSAVPNGLLEALGQAQFPAPGGTVVAAAESSETPLVLITTNEERALPDAFVRRCLVLQLRWPEDGEELLAALIARGRAHFPQVGDAVLRAAAEMVAEDRREVGRRGVCPPGGAEYLDLVRAVSVQWPRDERKQREALEIVRRFVLRKHPEEPAW